MTLRSFGITAAVVIAGCGAAHSNTTIATRTPAVRTRSVTFVVPPTGTPRLLAREPGGAAYYVAGGARVRLRDGDAVTANQGFGSVIAGGGRVASRWWFVSNEGTVASAADYLDNLRFERSLAAPVVRAFVSHEALIALMADGRVMRVDVAPLVAMPATVAQSPEGAPMAVPEDEATRVAESALRQFPLARVLLPSSVILDSGDVALRSASTMYFANVGSDGTLEATARIALGSEAGGDCAMHPWGARAVLTCPSTRAGDDSSVITPYVVDHDGADRVGPPARGPLLIGREGHTLTFARACPDAQANASGAPASAEFPSSDRSTAALVGCTLDRDRDWREWEYPTRARLLDVYDAAALVLEPRDGNNVLRYYDIDMGRGIDIRLDDPAAEIARAGFAPDGRIVVLATAGSGTGRRSLVGVAAPGSTLDLHVLGFYARDVDFADARFGLAVGETAADIAESHDGGVTWLRIEDIGMDGTPRALRLFAPEAPRHVSDPPPRTGTEVRCTPALCRIGTRMVHTWDRSVEIVPPLP